MVGVLLLSLTCLGASEGSCHDGVFRPRRLCSEGVSDEVGIDPRVFVRIESKSVSLVSCFTNRHLFTFRFIVRLKAAAFFRLLDETDLDFPVSQVSVSRYSTCTIGGLMV